MASPRHERVWLLQASVLLLLPMLVLLTKSLELPFHFTRVFEEVVVAGRNQAVQLNCSLSSNVSSSRFSWRFESEIIPANDSRRQLKPNGSLLIKKFVLQRKSKKNNSTSAESSRRSDEGRYFCVLSSDVGAAFAPPIRLLGASKLLP